MANTVIAAIVACAVILTDIVGAGALERCRCAAAGVEAPRDIVGAGTVEGQRRPGVRDGAAEIVGCGCCVVEHDGYAAVQGDAAEIEWTGTGAGHGPCGAVERPAAVGRE